MSLLFISLISDCFFPLERESLFLPTLSSGRAEGPVLFLARGAPFLTLLNRVETIPSTKPLPTLFFRIQRKVLAGVCVCVWEPDSNTSVEMMWRFDHKLLPFTCVLTFLWVGCHPFLPPPPQHTDTRIKTPPVHTGISRSQRQHRRALRHICRHSLINSRRLNRGTSKVSKTHNYWH